MFSCLPLRLREEFRPTIRNFRRVHETRARPTKHNAQSSRKVLKLKEGLSFGLLTRLKEDKLMISVSLSLQPRAAAAVLTQELSVWL